MAIDFNIFTRGSLNLFQNQALAQNILNYVIRMEDTGFLPVY